MGDFGLDILIEYAVDRDHRRVLDAAVPIHHHGHHGGTVPRRPPAVAQRRAFHRDQAIAVNRDAAVRNLIHHGGAAGCQAHDIAVARAHRLRHLAIAGQLRMGNQVARLAMHRHGDLRADPLVHLDQFVLGRVPGHMDIFVARSDDIDAHGGQLVEQPPDGALVAGDLAAGENHRVAGVERDLRMVVGGDARQGRARLTLTAGADQQHLVARQVIDFRIRDKGRQVFQVPGLLCRLDDTLHGTADQRHPPAVGLGGAAYGVQARDVRGEGGNRHPVFQGPDQFDKVIAHVGLGTRCARHQHVGRIADHRQYALLADAHQRRLVGAGADHGVRVELPVAGMQHGARAGSDNHRVGFGDRMGQRDELDPEGTDIESAGHGYLGNFRRLLQPRLRQLAAQHGGGEGRGVDRAFELRPEPVHGAQMVFMGMGQHQASEVFLALHDEGGVGHDDFDAGRRIVAEGYAQIDHQPFAVMAVEIEVHADLAGPAQRQEDQVLAAQPIDVEMFRHLPLFRRCIRMRPWIVRSRSIWSNSVVASANIGASPPVATTGMARSPSSARIRWIKPSISPT